MDTKRLIIAMVISFGLMFGWMALSSHMGWLPKQEPVQEQNQPAENLGAQNAANAQSGADAAVNSNADANQQASFAGKQGKDITISTPLYTAVFNNNGGVLKSFELKNYQSTDPETRRPSGKPLQIVNAEAGLKGNLGIIIGNTNTWAAGYENSAQWVELEEDNIKLENGTASITLNGVLNGINITRTLTFNAANYVVGDKVAITSENPQLVNYGVQFITGDLSAPTDYFPVTKVAGAQNGSFVEHTNGKDLDAGLALGNGYSWAGNMGTYFVAAAMPADKSTEIKAVHQGATYNLLLEKTNVPLSAAQSFNTESSYYLGPKRVADLEAAPADLSAAMDYGWFGWIAAPLLAMLKWFYAYCGNWGIAIILLTVVIKIVLWPLSYKSYKSMDNMKKLQPLMMKIREKYKDDKQRQNQEVMQLYKTYKINPAGGCLPILVQMPVFFGLYRALLNSIELRHASFIEYIPFTDIAWLTDLSLKDPYYITPIIMGLTMLIQQKFTPSTGDPTQQKVMMLMPIVFTALFVTFPSGLVLYWLFNNIISILQQQGQMRFSARSVAKK